jgi:Ca2+/H+ antiporter
MAPLSPASGRCPRLIAALCILTGAIMAPLLLIAALCIVAGARDHQKKPCAFSE